MKRGSHQNPWKALKERGDWQERHVQMAIDLGMSADSIHREHARADDRGDLLLLEWEEDRFFAKHGHYCPESGFYPENQAEHPADNSLWNVPLVVMNDGDVTALAGALSLQQTEMLGIAMGSSEAAGFIDKRGRILGWLNELAFAPVD